MVYQLLFTYTLPIELLNRGRRYRSRCQHPVQFLRTCRFIKEEATPIFYASNILHFWSSTSLLAWLNEIGPSRSLIMHVQMVGYPVKTLASKIGRKLSEAKHLATFDLDMYHKQEGPIQLLSERTIKGLKPLFQMLCEREGGVDQAMKVFSISIALCWHCEKASDLPKCESCVKRRSVADEMLVKLGQHLARSSNAVAFAKQAAASTN